MVYDDRGGSVVFVRVCASGFGLDWVRGEGIISSTCRANVIIDNNTLTLFEN